jgi:hypothetical protein
MGVRNGETMRLGSTLGKKGREKNRGRKKSRRKMWG